MLRKEGVLMSIVVRCDQDSRSSYGNADIRVEHTPRCFSTVGVCGEGVIFEQVDFRFSTFLGLEFDICEGLILKMILRFRTGS